MGAAGVISRQRASYWLPVIGAPAAGGRCKVCGHPVKRHRSRGDQQRESNTIGSAGLGRRAESLDHTGAPRSLFLWRADVEAEIGFS